MNALRFCAFALAIVLTAPAVTTRAQQKPLSPTETMLAFYKLLREQRYREGFDLSVFREAVEGLGDEELAELVPDFQQTFSDIPEKIDVKGEQAGTDAATVFAKFTADGDVQEVSLVREDGRWLVGDRESLEQVRQERNAFFFNARIRVNHNEVFQLMKKIVGSEDIHFKRAKAFGDLTELVAQEGLPADLKDGETSGYKFVVNLTPDRQGYTVTAYPLRYGRTGQLSFYGDAKSIRGADAQGRPVDDQAPVLEANKFEDSGQ